MSVLTVPVAPPPTQTAAGATPAKGTTMDPLAKEMNHLITEDGVVLNLWSLPHYKSTLRVCCFYIDEYVPICK